MLTINGSKLIASDYRQVLDNKVPKQLFIETTNICNANCIFCGYQFDKRPKVTMSTADLERILTEYKDLGGKVINFTPYAGEVFSDRDFLDKVKLASDIGFDEINTFTNATLLDKFGYSAILNSGLTSLWISTAPPDEKLYKKIYRSHLYKRVWSNIVNLAEQFHTVEDKTITKLQISFRSDRPIEKVKLLPDFKLLSPYVKGDLAVDALCHFDTWMGAIGSEDLVPGMKIMPANQEKVVPCDRLYMLKVTSNGKYRACGCRYDYQKPVDDFYLGDSQDISIIEAYNSLRLEEIKNKFRKGCPPEECQKCSWYESSRYKGQ